jgi:hypothetical protein
MRIDSIQPERLRLFFALTGAFHLASILSAFPAFTAKLPAALPAIILWAHFPILFFGGYLQGRTETGEDKGSALPLWMRLDGVARFSFALAVSYLFIIIIKTYQISLGPVDPLSAPGKELKDQLQWYAIWSIGSVMLLAMGPAATLVAGLQVITYPARKLPALIAIPLVFAAGIGAGFGALKVIASSQVSGVVHSAYDINERFAETSAGMISVLAAVTFLYKLILAPRRKE